MSKMYMYIYIILMVLVSLLAHLGTQPHKPVRMVLEITS